MLGVWNLLLYLVTWLLFSTQINIGFEWLDTGYVNVFLVGPLEDHCLQFYEQLILVLIQGLLWWFEVIVSGKHGSQHAKAMKFKDGYMISSGQPVIEYIDSAVGHVLQGRGDSWHQCEDYVGLGSKGQARPYYPLPDIVTIHMPNDGGVRKPPCSGCRLRLDIAANSNWHL